MSGSFEEAAQEHLNDWIEQEQRWRASLPETLKRRGNLAEVTAMYLRVRKAEGKEAAEQAVRERIFKARK